MAMVLTPNLRSRVVAFDRHGLLGARHLRENRGDRLSDPSGEPIYPGQRGTDQVAGDVDLFAADDEGLSKGGRARTHFRDCMGVNAFLGEVGESLFEMPTTLAPIFSSGLTEDAGIVRVVGPEHHVHGGARW
jgi:hypothetical protein